MRIYIGFDDTDDKDAPIGTGRLVRQFIYSLPNTCRVHGVIRHQLPRLSDIPFTSNNSSACAIIDVDSNEMRSWLTERAVSHLMSHCAPGSDPGLCIAEESEIDDGLIEFGKTVTGVQVTQKDAMYAARNISLQGLGGTNDGIIGATAAVGLTKFGWCGRFIEYGRLRDLGESMHVRDLMDAGIRVVSVDRDPLVPLLGDQVVNAGWIRPSLWAGHPTLQLRLVEYGIWEPAHSKRKKPKQGKGLGKGIDRKATVPCTAQ
ncbi:hypothetical protein [Pseudodesulfovibrio sp. zrk46]|uniref:hypothetical protein n=1 Tax=Pseudodesulfovibrio sp. zrk46 TaxID=2725288 RepID=UPI001FFD5A1C|nr:hypothetical protein [Pseudodesulfovibrio sp. zrk46]